MKYFFILGNNPTLSIAEISAVFGLYNLGTGHCPVPTIISENVLILETDQELNVKELIKKLGGTIKIGLIKTETSKNRILESTKAILDTDTLSGKFHFGFSYYGTGKINLKTIGMETKKYLREKDISCRWVTSKDKTLSSVVVEQNKLTRNGMEIVLIQDKDKILLGKTLAVQAFKELSKRDYGRPSRDDKSGMLPPKLAQIMINLSNQKTRHGASLREIILLDPFCGSGTIITEAMLMGYQNLIGTDISEKAINDTRDNVSWIQNNYQSSIINLQLSELSATNLTSQIQPNSIDTIVTEPYLGPQRGKIDFQKTVEELNELYSKAIQEFKKIIKKQGTVVMLFPVFYNKYFLNPDLGKFKIINPIPNDLRDNKIINLTKRNTIIYGREGQKVWREIVILRK